ncbi:MAG: molybdopterin-dependent oxidoreductase, partial [Proteobacteria bacterium]|nr:molybdopterin-dependent oxidoreductase [Pseudomonadota bacterium]
MGKWSRRGFIAAGVVAGGGLAVGVGLRIGNRNEELAGLVTEGDETLVHTWVKIGADNKVTAIIPHAEMGQGVHTALSQMLADELDAAWEDVSFIEAPAEMGFANYPLGRGFILPGVEIPTVLAPTVDGAFLQVAKMMGLQITGGSASVRATGVYGMRLAGAATREMLMSAAAQAWQVDSAALSTENGHVLHAASGKREPYSSFATAAAQLTPPVKPRLKQPSEFKIMGKSVPRFDIPEKVTGEA